MRAAIQCALVCAVVTLAAGCKFAPPNGVLICNSTGKACPTGYECGGDNRCYKNGTAPGPDLATETPDDMAMNADVDMAKVMRNQGEACDPDTTICSTGFCVDGVCCDTACVDNCNACNLDGAKGVCTAIPSGGSPVHGSCAMQQASTCGTTGVCDGTGKCALYAAGTTCGAPMCDSTSGNFTPPPQCDGAGMCKPLASFNCAPYTCKDATACNATCTDPSQCSGSNSCVNNSCGTLPIGRDCTMDAQCGSGHCVDGVCCNSTCTGQCQACDIPDGSGNRGTCTQVSGTPRNGRPACTGAGTTCGGTCSTSPTACTYPTSATLCSTSCKSTSTVTEKFCNGAGACGTGVDRVCSNNYSCLGTTCGSTCTMNNQCQTNYVCAQPNCISRCTDATKDGDESDIDCGGTVCGKCPMDKSCGTGADCISNSCVSTMCTPASGPPDWISGASMQYGREQHALVTSKGKVYAIGGTEWYDASGDTRAGQSVEVYTPSYLTSSPGGTWAFAPSLLNAAVSLGATVRSDGTIVKSGGWYSDLSDTEEANTESLLPPAASWSARTDYPVARQGLRAATGSDGNAYFVGGGPLNAGNCSNQLYRWNLLTPDTWTAMPSMANNRCDLAFVADATGRLWAFNGRLNTTLNGTGITSIESWKPGDASWATSSISLTNRYYNTGALGADGRIYLIGGEMSNAFIATNQTVTAFKSNRIVFLPTPPFTSISRAAATQGPDGRIYLTGGRTTLTNTTPTEFLYMYGPYITLSTVSGKSGSTVLVTCKNFAAGSTIKLYWDSVSGNPVVTAGSVTNASGDLASTLSFTVPAATQTVHKIIGIDERAAYPVSADFTVTP